jgi:DNA-directed RNA polymerase subunit E'/Rpb7
MSDIIQFHVVFECMVCMPVEGMLIECRCKTITKAGLHAEVIDSDGVMPLTVFVARDHHHRDERLNKIQEGDMITVSIIGIRFELNDTYICAIAKLTNITSEKPRIHIQKGGNSDNDLSDDDEF